MRTQQQQQQQQHHAQILNVHKICSLLRITYRRLTSIRPPAQIKSQFHMKLLRESNEAVLKKKKKKKSGNKQQQKFRTLHRKTMR